VLTGAQDLANFFGDGDEMFANFVTDRGGQTLSGIISLSVALAIINADIAFVILVARVLFSTGRDQVWPAPVNRALMHIHPRFASPWIATLACGALAAALCFVPMGVLLVLTGTTIVVVYGSLCVAAIVGRRTGRTAGTQYRMPFYPWPAVLALAGLCYILYASALDPDLGQPSLRATAIVVALSAAYYWLILRRRGTWVLHAPQDTEQV
jgi:amino acid transporter